MLSKLRLKQTDQYEQSVATYETAQMIVQYILDGRDHAKNIGSEQGGIIHWDDFVVEQADGIFRHLQVKRQTTPFCSLSVNRTVKKGANPSGELQDLSEFDKAMKSLGDWIVKNSLGKVSTERTFMIVVPEGTVSIKKTITINNLDRLCSQEISALTDINRFRNLRSIDSVTNDICTWLTEWCDYRDDDVILSALKNLKIKITGNPLMIDTGIRNQLQRCFSDIDTVLSQIHSLLDTNSTFTNAITPRDVHRVLNGYLLNTTPNWTQYYLNSGTWEISGTHDANSPEPEMPAVTVPALWNAAKTGIFKLKGTRIPDDIGRAIVRLIVHLQNHPTAYIDQSQAWLEAANRLLGGTLGIDEEDCLPKNWKVVDEPNVCKSTNIRTLSTAQEIDDEARCLNEQMNEFTWEEIKQQVTSKIRSMPSSELRAELDKRWASWKVSLDNLSNNRYMFLSSMLTVKAEGQSVFPDVRLGPKTTKILKQAIFLHLVIAIGLSEMDLGWQSVGTDLSIAACALTHWSGPSDENRTVRKITDDNGLEKLLGQVTSKILLMSGTEVHHNDLTTELLGNGKVPENNIASPHRPILITNNRKFKKLIDKGEIEPIRAYITEMVTNVEASMTITNLSSQSSQKI